MKRRVAIATALACIASTAAAAPVVSRLTPPSSLFAEKKPLPIVARFVENQRFDLQATIKHDPGQTITTAQFAIDGVPLLMPVTVRPASPANTVIATLRAFSSTNPGVRELTVTALQSDGAVATAKGNFEIVDPARKPRGRDRALDAVRGDQRAKNVIVFIGDGMGIAHRSAARIMLNGVSQGKSRAFLAMDTFPYTGLVVTHSLNSIVTDSSPGSACYSTGNKGNNNQHGVFPDDTVPPSNADGSLFFDNPRVENIAQLLHRTHGKSLGLVTTSDVFDATPAAWASHTQSRGAGTGIVDQFFDERGLTGLSVLMGGGRKWFLPATAPGSGRSNGFDYVLPADLQAGWDVPAGALDPNRDLISEFQAAGFAYAPNRAALNALPGGTGKVLGLFALSNMNVALDKIEGRRGTSAVVDDYGFPDQPMLDEMTDKALEVLSRNPDGFVLMVEAASIDKQAHNMDSERWILDTLEFDRAIQKAEEWASDRDDTLIVVTADHECGGVNIIGGSRITQADLATRAAMGGGAAQLRNGVVGTYDAAGFPRYEIASDGYPKTTDVDYRMLVGYAANADRYEDWSTNARPLRDSQQPFNNAAPLNTYPSGPTNRDTGGGFLVTGQVADSTAVHTASDIPLSAYGAGAHRFTGTMDNTDVFFKIMEAVHVAK